MMLSNSVNQSSIDVLKDTQNNIHQIEKMTNVISCSSSIKNDMKGIGSNSLLV